MRRCRWCGRFVKADQPTTVRFLTVDTREPRNVEQLLCPVCSRAWSTNFRSNQPYNSMYPTEVLT